MNIYLFIHSLSHLFIHSFIHLFICHQIYSIHLPLVGMTKHLFWILITTGFIQKVAAKSFYYSKCEYSSESGSNCILWQLLFLSPFWTGLVFPEEVRLICVSQTYFGILILWNQTRLCFPPHKKHKIANYLLFFANSVGPLRNLIRSG